MSGHVPDPSPPRREGSGTSVLAWALPLSLTALVIVLAWKLYQSMPKATHDPSAQPRTVSARGDLAADEKATIDLFRTASPAVVQVTAFQPATDITGLRVVDSPQGSGSGFVWDADGYVVTNFHVVGVGKTYSVTISSHDVFDAMLVGQKVFAIGNPFGLDQTLTTGIISGLNREIVAPPPAKTPIQGVIQTDAAINPGNSGGPLLDSAGRVIGLNTQIASPSGASAGVGFAIPVDTLNRVVPQIIRTGHAMRPGLGIASILGVITQAGQRGVIFCNYAQSSAARDAGIRATEVTPTGEFGAVGDVIVGLDGQPVEGRADVFRILDTREIGQEIEVKYIRDGAEKTSNVKLVAVR